MQKNQCDGIIKNYDSIESYKEYLHTKLSKHYYTDGVIDRKFSDDEDIPEGFYLGRTNGVKKEGFTKGTKWINNGIEEKLIYDDILPEGYSFGKLPQTQEHKNKIRDSLRGKLKSEEHCKHLSESHKTLNYLKNYERTCLQKYGVRNVFQNEEVKKKCNTPEVVIKRFNAMRKNNTFNSSKREDYLYNILLTHFNKDDIIRQYGDSRYPFHCDFYIKSLDLFIELNAYWTHNNKPFDVTNKNHLSELRDWEQKATTSKHYKNAIEVWTKRDVEKLKSLTNNKLNYILIYDMNFENIVSSLEVVQWERIIK